jgi:short-subunit dehydrogenase involved in D-alanine esterification of teichoic acids
MSDTHGSTELSGEFLKHLVEAAGMKADIEHLRSTQSELTNRVLVSLGELAAELKSMRTDIQSVPERIANCRMEMRREVEKDFPNRVDAIEMEKRIENQMRETDHKLTKQITSVETNLNARIDKVDTKIDKLFVKIAATIAAVGTTLATVAWVIENVSPGVLK